MDLTPVHLSHPAAGMSIRRQVHWMKRLMPSLPRNRLHYPDRMRSKAGLKETEPDFQNPALYTLPTPPMYRENLWYQLHLLSEMLIQNELFFRMPKGQGIKILRLRFPLQRRFGGVYKSFLKQGHHEVYYKGHISLDTDIFIF